MNPASCHGGRRGTTTPAFGGRGGTREIAVPHETPTPRIAVSAAQTGGARWHEAFVGVASGFTRTTPTRTVRQMPDRCAASRDTRVIRLGYAGRMPGG
ncbi:hypothetical protein BCEP27_30750 [Burkholderia cepacia]